MSAVDREPIGLAAFDTLWEAGARGLSRPAVLTGDGPVDRPWSDRLVEQELVGAGYVDVDGVTADTRALLHTIARPLVAVDIRRAERTGASPTRWWTRVAAGDAGGVVAVLGPDGFRAWRFSPEDLVNQTVDLFPRHAPPPGFNGLTLPADAGRLKLKHQRLLGRDYLRRAHFNVVTRIDRMVGGERLGEQLVLNDTPDGRVLHLPAQHLVLAGSRQVFTRTLKRMVDR